jgi:lipoteichoic acid synthase
MQIGKYFEDLKEQGLYDNSLIIIVADHDARPRYLDMEGKISDDIPIYIINGGFDPSSAWDGECNQLDVYTTILDIMGIDSQWRGLGHTLLNKNYQNSVTGETQEISDRITFSNYFSPKTSE